MSATQSKPPRKLPLLSRLIILVGGIPSQIGWSILCYGMIFFWIFVINAEWPYILSMKKGQPHTAEIVDITPTGLLESWKPIFRYTYTYEVHGKSYTGKAYLKGNQLDEGHMVNIEYLTNNPSVSKMMNARSAPYGRWILFLIVIPLIGLAFILYSFRKNMKSLDLIECGLFASGKMIHKEATTSRINNQPIYKVIYEFEAENGKSYKAEGKTHRAHLLQEGVDQQIIYAQKEPSYSVLFDTIPFAPKMDEEGSFLPIPKRNMWVLVLPVLTVFGNIGYILGRFVL